MEIHIRELEEQMPFYKALGWPCSAVFKNTHEKEILGTGGHPESLATLVCQTENWSVNVLKIYQQYKHWKGENPF